MAEFFYQFQSAGFVNTNRADQKYFYSSLGIFSKAVTALKREVADVGCIK